MKENMDNWVKYPTTILRDNNTHRNSAYYSIIDTEWETVKPNLRNLYQEKNK